jgi:hypothetical protein
MKEFHVYISHNENLSQMCQTHPHPEIQDISNLHIKMPFKAYLWKLSVFLSTGKIFDLTFIHTPASREVELGRIIVGWFPVKNWQTTIKTTSQD